jgi:hypothetical protein
MLCFELFHGLLPPLPLPPLAASTVEGGELRRRSRQPVLVRFTLFNARRWL